MCARPYMCVCVCVHMWNFCLCVGQNEASKAQIWGTLNPTGPLLQSSLVREYPELEEHSHTAISG